MTKADKVDPSERRRGALTMALLILLMACFAAIDALGSHDWKWRLIDQVRVGAIMVLALVVSLRSTTAFSLRPRNPALDDELTRANRARAAAWGFWAFFVALMGAFAASFFWPIRLGETLLVVLVFGAAAAAMRFVALERMGV
jgi:hypothetical protein